VPLVFTLAQLSYVRAVMLDGSITELTSSGMPHINALYGEVDNTYRVAGPISI
jgi:hypothetical protein